MAAMRQEAAIDGFRLAYERTGRIGAGPAVLLLHGWPGDRTDYREVAPLVSAAAEVIVPDLRGFGESDKHQAGPAAQYDAAAQARRPDYEPAAGHLDHLVSVYGPPGAFAASIAWYRAGAGSVAASLAERAPEPSDRIATPTTVLWPEYDPLFPREWSDRIGEFFSAADLSWLDGAGHFSPLEAPEEWAAAIDAAARTGPG